MTEHPFAPDTIDEAAHRGVDGQRAADVLQRCGAGAADASRSS
jgi:hypothetical protein